MSFRRPVTGSAGMMRIAIANFKIEGEEILREQKED